MFKPNSLTGVIFRSSLTPLRHTTYQKSYEKSSSPMYLKIGNYEICNSTTDGITKAIKTPIPTLQKRNDSVHPLGSTNAIHLYRKGSSREIEITVVRQFASYRDAEVWVIEHFAEMEVLKAHGDLDFESMLGVGYLYGSAALDSVEVTDFTGVSLEVRYIFKAGKAITYVAFSVTEEESGIEYLVSMDDGVYPLVRVAK